jgi:hypothetical protein
MLFLEAIATVGTGVGTLRNHQSLAEIQASLAERVGFEPTVRLPYNGFRDRSMVEGTRESHSRAANNAGCEPLIWTYSRASRV